MQGAHSIISLLNNRLGSSNTIRLLSVSTLAHYLTNSSLCLSFSFSTCSHSIAEAFSSKSLNRKSMIDNRQKQAREVFFCVGLRVGLGRLI